MAVAVVSQRLRPLQKIKVVHRLPDRFFAFTGDFAPVLAPVQKKGQTGKTLPVHPILY
jgi:hypothetical protein